MKKTDHDRINSHLAQKAELQKQKMAVLLELEVDEVTKAEEDAINKINKELERKISSPKRRITVDALCARAEVAKETVKARSAEKIQRLQSRYNIA